MVNTLWLCLRFPQLPLDIILRGNGTLAGPMPKAIAIVQNQRVTFVSAAARSAGVTPGMTFMSACALAANLTAVERQPQREEKALQFLADWAYQFTPAVSLQPPDILLLEIAGCLRLFQGLQHLRHTIDTGLQQLGFTYASGLAHTPKAAIAFSQSAQPPHRIDHQRPTADTFLQPLRHIPLTQLTLDSKHLRQLHQLGLSRTGELLTLPKADLGKRFGKDFVTYLEKLTGERPDLQPYITPSPCFESEIHVLNGLSTVETLAHPVKWLLQELHQYLMQRQLHCSGFSWRFFHFDKQASYIRIELSRAQNHVDNFFSLTQLKMEKLKLISEVETVQLHTDQLVPAELDSQPLFRDLSGTSDSDPWLLLDKLRGRLGPEALYSLQLQDEHLPECRQLKSASGAQQSHAANSPPRHQKAEEPSYGQEHLASLPHPLWLLDPPQPVKRRQGKLYFQGALTLIGGPQRFDSHWWHERQQRDYFIAQHQNGSYYWVYKDYQRRHWFVHGVFG